jgi:hypothetical protein
MNILRSVVGRVVVVASIAIVLLAGEYALLVNRQAHGDLATNSGVNQGWVANAAGGNVNNCFFYSSAPTALTTTDYYPCRLDSSQGTYTFVDNFPALTTVTLQATAPIIEAGTATNNPGFGTAHCTPSPACGVLIKNGTGVVKGIRWNSTTALGSIVLSCWDSTSAGNYDNLLFLATNISPGGVVPIPPGGDKFSNGLFCQVSAFISTTQNFAFEVQ